MSVCITVTKFSTLLPQIIYNTLFTHLKGRMDTCRWLNGWMNEWMNGWMNGWMGGWMNEWMDGWMDGWMVASCHVVQY